VKVLVEGITPAPGQVNACKALWNALSIHMSFEVATFCPTLMKHCREIACMRSEMPSKDLTIRTYFAVYSTPGGVTGSLTVKVPKTNKADVETLVRRMVSIIK
jgi:hypothetical protein